MFRNPSHASFLLFLWLQGSSSRVCADVSWQPSPILQYWGLKSYEEKHNIYRK